MALVYNASNIDQNVKVFGKHFSIPSGKIKMFQDEIGRFLVIERKDQGLVGLSDRFEDPDYKDTLEGRQELAKAKAEGVANRITHLKRLIYNETVSLQQDLDQANIKVNAKAFMSDSMVDVMRELTTYQKADEDALEQRLKEIEKLEAKLK